jgi:nucleobase:cation symporter-1, NCS1 family
MTRGQSETDRFGHIEVRGISVIPDSDRHGQPREVFWVWLASNAAFTYILLGGLLVVLGLSIWQAILAQILGILFFIFVAVVGAAGPKAGTPTMIISRAQYGIHGTRISAFIAWFTVVAFEAINLTIGASAAFALARFAGWNLDTVGEAFLLALIAAVTFSVAILGHATLVVFQQVFAYALLAIIVPLFIFVVPDVNWDYSAPLSGSDAAAIFFIGLMIIISLPLSWIMAPADLTRYFPRSTPPRPIIWYAAIGYFIPTIALGVLAILAGTVVDMSDPTTSMKALMPDWFYALFLLIIIGGSITNNVFTVYTSGLSLQAMGLQVKRHYAVAIDAIVGTAMAVYAIFITDFLTTLSEFLQLALVWYAPFAAIFFVDVLLRRFEYSGPELHRPGGAYWYDRGFNWSGLGALAAGMVTAFLFANTAHWQSPISTEFLNGADISALPGMVVAGGLYWVLHRRRAAVPVAPVAGEIR